MYKSRLNSRFELLATDFVELNKNWNYRDVTSTFYRLYYIERGHGLIYNADGSLKLEPGNLYLVPSFTHCNYYCDEYMSQYYICFTEVSADGSSLFSSNRKLFRIAATDQDEAIIRRILDLNPRRDLSGSHNPKSYEKSNMIDDLSERNKMVSFQAYIETCGMLLQIISRFIGSENYSLADNRATNSRVSEAIYFIQTNLQHPITVQTLAARANRDPSYFSRLFYAETGEHPLVYIQKTRVSRAQLLLLTTSFTIAEISIKTGFESMSYFARVFKKMTGQTPGSYKRNILNTLAQ